MFERIVTAPAVEPVTVEELCQFGRIHVPSEDDGGSPPGPNLDRVELQGFIVAARRFIENLTKVAMISQRQLLTFDCFPDQEDYYVNVTSRVYYPYIVPLVPPHFREDSIEVLRRPLQESDPGSASPPIFSATTVKYMDQDGELQTFDADNYVVFANVITLKPGKCWPNAAAMRNAVRIEYPCGYGDTAADVPEELKQAVKFLATYWFEKRLPAGETPSVEAMLTLSAILAPFKLFRVPR